jgi:hypothetical protein
MRRSSLGRGNGGDLIGSQRQWEPSRINEALLRADIAVSQLVTQRLTLEDLFLELTRQVNLSLRKNVQNC